MEYRVIDKATYFSRGDVARKLNIHPETLRYYEEKKLITHLKRSSNNYRVYNSADIDKIKFILSAKNLGFSLKEIKELIDLSLNDKTNRKKLRAMANKKSQLISYKIKQLEAIKNVLDTLIKACRGNKSSNTCPIVLSLYQGIKKVET